MKDKVKLITQNECYDYIGIPYEERELMLMQVKLYKKAVEARKEANMTQQDVSEKTKLHVPSISKLENGNTDLRVSTLMRYLGAMGKTITITDIDEQPKKRLKPVKGKHLEAR